MTLALDLFWLLFRDAFHDLFFPGAAPSGGAGNREPRVLS